MCCLFKRASQSKTTKGIFPFETECKKKKLTTLNRVFLLLTSSKLQCRILETIFGKYWVKCKNLKKDISSSFWWICNLVCFSFFCCLSESCCAAYEIQVKLRNKKVQRLLENFWLFKNSFVLKKLFIVLRHSPYQVIETWGTCVAAHGYFGRLIFQYASWKEHILVFSNF